MGWLKRSQLRWHAVRRALRWVKPSAASSHADAALARLHNAEGNAARDRSDWIEAERLYRESLAADNRQAAIYLQYGHVLKTLDRLTDAELAYRAGIAIHPSDPDALLQLGHVLKLQGRKAESIDAYASALAVDPDFEPARNELIASGARDRIPGSSYSRAGANVLAAHLSQSVDTQIQLLRGWSSKTIFPLGAYSDFRRVHPILPPPSPPASGKLLVVIDARDVEAAALRTTLLSLVDQSMSDWVAIVVARDELLSHPVASLLTAESRLTIVPASSWTLNAILAERNENRVLLLPGHIWLDPQALAWLSYASARTGAEVVYADHDFHIQHWRTGRTHIGPVFQPMADAIDLETTPEGPALILISHESALGLACDVADEPEAFRTILKRAARCTTVAHLPRLLSSLPENGESTPPPPPPPQHPAPKVDGDLRLLVVIPTKDEASILEACVNSLRRLAARSELVDILVVDHESQREDTALLLKKFAADASIKVTRVEGPFNWSRFNNEAVRGSVHDILVFANNDVEMRTRGWDERVRESLGQDSVGVIGARLLYPDGSLQHAGILLGAEGGRPIHEGRGSTAGEDGPLRRWARCRNVAAVTGAFMAVRRSVFEAVGGFDPSLAIAYNDLDFCLRVRAHNWRVVYRADLELTHHESRTRGYNVAASRVAWDDAELASLYERWGDWMFFDPGVNPHWTSTGEVAFDGYREPVMREVLDHLDMSAKSNPWAVDQSELAPER